MAKTKYYEVWGEDSYGGQASKKIRIFKNKKIHIEIELLINNRSL